MLKEEKNYTKYARKGIIKANCIYQNRKNGCKKVVDSMAYTLKEGNYEKLGVQIKGDAIIFTFEGEKEDDCSILLYGKNHELLETLKVPKEYCMGSVRSVSVTGISTKHLMYNYEINGKVMTDVYAERIVGREKWNDGTRADHDYMIYGGYEPQEFSWGEDHYPEVPRHNMFMYKLHVRGFSMDAGIRGKERGTFRAVRDKIPYLKELGITTLEFMPVYEFEEIVLPEQTKLPDYLDWKSEEGDLITPSHVKASGKVNYWGYVPGNYFAVKASYSSTSVASLEWKELIRELHANGMECVMEMYFEEHMNQNVILDALRYWVREYHVDGFHLLGASVPVTAVAQDLLLSRTKIFYTGFEAILLEQKKQYHHLFVYSDEYLYPVRKMLNHMGGNVEEFVCQQRKQHHVHGFVNYIASNNGFTLRDVFSYLEKHNESNGEDNCDGNNWNYSSNCGVEGRTGKKFVNELRNRQLLNAAAILLLSQGVPLLLAGDEFGNSQDGNNNAYCQDNRTGWLNWRRNEKYQWLTAFIRNMAAFRKEHPILSSETPMLLNDYKRKGFPDLSYHGENAWISSFSIDKQAVGVMYCGAYAAREDGTEDDFIYVGYNFHNGLSGLALPKLPDKKKWRIVCDTSRGKEAFLTETTVCENQQQLSVRPQSVVILIGN